MQLNVEKIKSDPLLSKGSDFILISLSAPLMLQVGTNVGANSY